MLKNITELGPREAEFISIVASRQKIVTIKDATDFWKSPALTRKKMSRLQQKGWLERLERGKYMVIPLEAGPERQWSENSLYLAGYLASPASVAYWSAIRYWNWTEQLPQIVYVQTTQRKNTSRKTIMGVQYEIVTVPQAKYFGSIKQWEGEHSFWVTDKEKTLIDCADVVKRSGSIEELAKAVKNSASEIDFKKLDRYILQFPNGAVKKRLGFLFESLAAGLSQDARSILFEWSNHLSQGIAPLDPGGQKSGKINSRWKILRNIEI